MDKEGGSVVEVKVLVFGQRELVRGVAAGTEPGSHLVSIGDARPLLKRAREEERLPALFRPAFKRILRLSFNDRLSGERGGRGRPPRPRDLRRVVRFIERTKGEATGYAIHCWSGVSRSTAVALGILFLLGRDEDAAVRELLMIRPAANPHPEIVAWFDAELGSRLGEALSCSGEVRREVVRDRIRARVARSKEPLLGPAAGDAADGSAGTGSAGEAAGTGPS